MRWNDEKLLTGSNSAALAVGDLDYDDGLTGLTTSMDFDYVTQAIEVMEALGYSRGWFRIAHNVDDEAPLLAITPDVHGDRGVILAPVLPTDEEWPYLPDVDGYNLLAPSQVPEVRRRLEEETDLDDDDVLQAMTALLPNADVEGADG